MFPELRKDPISGYTVLIAPGRSARPMTLTGAESIHRPPRHRRSESAHCPFCPGNEHETPAPVMTSPSEGDWELRIVPNKYPAVAPEEPGCVGGHDVIIPCREHESSPSRLSPQSFRRMVRAWRDRIRQLSVDARLAHATMFMNVGAEAGASLDHLHSQILATPFVPEAMRRELIGHTEWRSQHGGCWYCGTAANIVMVANGMKVVCPEASRFAFETWLIPEAHRSTFEAISEGECNAFADALRSTLIAIDAELHEPAFNLYLHTAPFRHESDFHWHCEVIPRTARAAGFEWGAGVFINTVDPAAAAIRFRRE
jgi:UDPglucose--hexose-1-phosphate uridylyltransferase